MHFGHLKVDEKFCKPVPSEKAEAKTSQAATIALAGRPRRQYVTRGELIKGFGTLGVTYSSVI